MTTKWKIAVLAGAGVLMSLGTTAHAAPPSPGVLAQYAVKDGSAVQKAHFRRHHHRHHRRSYGYGYGIPFISLGFGGHHHGHHGGFGHGGFGGHGGHHGGFGHGGFGGHGGGHHGHH